MLIKSCPMQLCVANMVKRVLRIVREYAKENNIPLPIEEEHKASADIKEVIKAESIFDIIKSEPDKSGKAKSEKIDDVKLKEKLEKDRRTHYLDIKQQIEDLIVEMDNMRSNILSTTKEYILPNDVILTYDLSLTLIEFFAVFSKCKSIFS